MGSLDAMAEARAQKGHIAEATAEAMAEAKKVTNSSVVFSLLELPKKIMHTYIVHTYICIFRGVGSYLMLEGQVVIRRAAAAAAAFYSARNIKSVSFKDTIAQMSF